MSVPKYMNRIRGINEWMSKHSFAKSEEYQKLIGVDPAGIGRKLFTLPREISYATSSNKEKSAEVIVVEGKRAPTDRGGLTKP